MDLSILLVNWNSAALVEQCLTSLERSGTRCAVEVILADNASRPEEVEALRRVVAAHPYVRCVWNSENHGFGVGNNSALPACRGRYVLFLNTDTIVLESLDALVATADALGPRCGALGGRVLNPDRTLQLTCREPYTVPVLHAGMTLAFAGIKPGFVRRNELAHWDHASAREVGMLSGCYLLVPSRVLAEVGGFDPQIFHFFEDTDLCYRIHAAGYQVVYAPVAAIIHLGGGASRASGLSDWTLATTMASARYFTRKHLGAGRARLLVLSVWLTWLAMWLVLAPTSLLMPIPRVRGNLRRRACLLRKVLVAVPRQRIPVPTRASAVGVVAPAR